MGLFFTSLAEKQEVVFRQDKKFEDIAFSDHWLSLKLTNSLSAVQ